MWISERFRSIQGEGRYLGVDSVFVRTSGCNLRCHFCDTPYTSWEPTGEHLPWEEVADWVLGIDCDHVVLTGGEPLLQTEVVPFTERLAIAGRLVTIETAGTFDRPVHAHLMSISPKLSNSRPTGHRFEATHERRRINLPVLHRFLEDYDCQLKFVVADVDDLMEIEQILEQLPDDSGSKVWLMPEGTEIETLNARLPWITREAKRRGWNVSPRQHIELFGNTRGT